MEASKWASVEPIQTVAPPENHVTPQPPTQEASPAAHDPMDEFAQTRPPDDLFADDFTPIVEPLPEEESPTSIAPTAPSAQRQARGRGSQRAGRGRAGPARSTSSSQRVPPMQEPQQPQKSAEGPKKEAVRGDRSGTGGIKKAKLTEEELNARMEAIKLKNASLEAAHARAEADQLSFQQREAEAQQRMKVERQNRQQLMGEREKNRLRKLNAQKGREWDAEKGDDDKQARDGAGSRYMRGARGVVASSNARPDDEGQNGSQIDVDGIGNRGANRGRGRGRGPRGGRGRGGFDAPQTQASETKEPKVPTDEDFPALAAANPASAGPLNAEKANIPGKSAKDETPTKATEEVAGGGAAASSGSWAEQMENSAGA